MTSPTPHQSSFGQHWAWGKYTLQPNSKKTNMAIQNLSPDVSRGLAKLFNEKGIFDLTERENLINKYDSLEALQNSFPPS